MYISLRLSLKQIQQRAKLKVGSFQKYHRESTTLYEVKSTVEDLGGEIFLEVFLKELGLCWECGP